MDLLAYARWPTERALSMRIMTVSEILFSSGPPSVYSAIAHSPNVPVAAGLAVPTLFSGCETTDKMLGAAERAVSSTTGRTVLDIVTGRTLPISLGNGSKQYSRDPQALLRSPGHSTRLEALMAALTGEVGGKWAPRGQITRQKYV